MTARPVRVLFVSGEYPPLLGGVGAYTAELARALLAQGADVRVLTDPQAAAPGGERVLAGQGWGWRLLRRLPGLAAELGVDWVHVQYQTAAFGMHPAINFLPYFLRRRGIPCAWTYHDLLVPYLFPKAGSRLRRWVTRLPAHTARAVITTNQDDWTALRGAIPQQGLFRIPIGSNISGRQLSPQARAQRRAMRGYSDGQLLLGYFGFLNASKGGLTLVDTLAALVAQGWDAHLLMIGERVGASDPTNYAYWQQVEARIAQHSLAGRVQWTGRQPDGEVAADLNGLDVLVMLYADGLSLRRGTLMAGLANGCAIVTTAPPAPVPGLRPEADLLLVPPGDARAAAAAVAQIAGDAELATRLRGNARRAARQFGWDAIAARHLQVYTGLAEIALNSP